MKLENQVCTLEQAKRLKELGIEQHSICLWLDYSNHPFGPKVVWYDAIHFETDRTYIYSAFNVAELGEIITGSAIGSTYWLRNFSGCHVQLLKGNEKETFSGATEAQARAALLIDLLESGKILPREANALLC